MSYKTIDGRASKGHKTHIFMGSHGRCYCGLVGVYATYSHKKRKDSCLTCLKAAKAEDRKERKKWSK